MKLPVLLAGDGAPWEADLVMALDRADLGVTIVRRCVDIIEVLAVAVSVQAQAAVLAAGLPRLDADAVDRLIAAAVTPVGVVAREDAAAEERLRALGISYLVPSDADPSIVVSVIEAAVAAAGADPVRDPEPGTSSRGFSYPPELTSTVIEPPAYPDDRPLQARLHRRGLGTDRRTGADHGRRHGGGRVVPARGNDEPVDRCRCLRRGDRRRARFARRVGRLGGGVSAGRDDAGRSTDVGQLVLASAPRVSVLTGIPRAELWPELRPSALTSVLAAARGVADFVVIDCGFCLESDEEVSYDSLAPRRNGATLAILDAADLVLIVGSADPLGLQRLTRGLTALRDAEVSATSWVVLNRVRGSVVPGDPPGELSAALLRFTGRVPAALLPLDQDAVDAATASGQTLAEARPGSLLRRAFVELAAAVAEVDVPVPRRHRRRR